jgi:hypothetical protein
MRAGSPALVARTARPSRVERALLRGGARWRLVALHVAVWAAVLGGICLIVTADPGPSGRAPTWRGPLAFLWTMAPQVYAARWLMDRRTLRWPLRGLAMVAASSVWLPLSIPASRALGSPAPVVSIVAMSLITVAVFTACRAMWIVWHAEQQLPLAERLQSAAEQRLLGARLAPQVLRESLQVLGAIADRAPQSATPHILDVATMMRHLVEGSRQEWVPLAAERDYLLACTRLLAAEDESQPPPVVLEVEGDCAGMVPSLLCVTLFQVMRRAAPAPLQVRLQGGNSGMAMACSVAAPHASMPPPDLDLGLALVRRRLEQVAPGQFVLRWEHRHGHFTLELISPDPSHLPNS